ncbi:MAG: LCP family protein [Oscillospiraceae bacterium]|nr:LCP family protein [Oscillospiraceae bacterium]
MAKEIYFSDHQNDGSQFDTEAFKKRFNEIKSQNENGTKSANDSLGFSGTPEKKPAGPQNSSAGAGKKKPKKKKKVLLAVTAVLLGIVLLITGSLAGAAAYITSGYEPGELKENAYISESSLMSSAGVTNILLMGIDTKDVSAMTRSDSMILLSIDNLHGTVKLTSFMRDMYVTVPGHGDTKLTHACAYEGPQLTVDTIEMNFGIKIDAYIKIGYSIFVELVNGIGGITVAEIDATESKALAREGVNIEPGTNIHLNGSQALHYCRIRKGQSDFQRTERQREAITLIIKKAIKTNPVKLMKLAKSIVPQVESSLSKADIMELAIKTLPCVFGEITQLQIPADGTWSSGSRDGMSVLLIDKDKNKSALKEFIY